jgi:hypothetical protein
VPDHSDHVVAVASRGFGSQGGSFLASQAEHPNSANPLAGFRQIRVGKNLPDVALRNRGSQVAVNLTPTLPGLGALPIPGPDLAGTASGQEQ